MEFATIAIELECCGVALLDPGAAFISGTLDMEFGDSIMVFTPAEMLALLP
jgi:hypothetical protein